MLMLTCELKVGKSSETLEKSPWGRDLQCEGEWSHSTFMQCWLVEIISRNEQMEFNTEDNIQLAFYMNHT